ncbi:MAG: histidine--tRNA ligase [Anaerolineales bacterium]|nr:histidine--tRNA ligase [Anaerolineales bacterium]
MARDVVRSVKGTRDFYPEEMGARIWLYEKMRQVSESFGYSEFEGPMLETYELYIAKSSQEIVEKQSFVFEDRGGDKLTLRPELTPTLARMVAARQPQLTFPLRWWSFGPFWRYERPQKGRTREFFQWNIDLLGDDSPEADAELIAIAASFLKEVGLTSGEVRILVNNRELMDKHLATFDIAPEMRGEVFNLIDRRDKMSEESWQEYAAELGLTPKQTGQVIDLIGNQELWRQSDSLVKMFAALEAYGISDYVSFAPQIIRGLVYYTGTVFEAWDTSGEYRAIFGGGRYDNLVGDVGGDPVGGVGFAVGDLIITLILQQYGRLPEFGKTPSAVFFTLFDQSLLQESLKLANSLRQAGIKVTSQLTPSKLGKQFKYADRIGAKFAIVVGPDEAANNTVTIKNLATGEQTELPQGELVNNLKALGG